MKVAVVGAGPVGCVIALLLAKKGHDIQLYETYGETRTCKSRSINITLSDRGIHVLEKAIPTIHQTLLLDGVKAKGRIVHDKNGKQSGPTLYGLNGEAIISFKRNQLSDFLVREVKKTKNAKIFFHHELINCEPVTAKLTFRNTETHELVYVDADLIIGSDGAHSSIRHNMQKNNSLRFFEQRRQNHCYIEFHIPKNKSMDREMLHMWPRHDFMMLALPNKDGSFCGNLFMIKEDMQQVMRDSGTLIEFCRENFSDLLDIIGEQNLVHDIEPCANFSPYCLTSTKCEPYHAWGKVVIMGDAAHTVVPFYGQGMNAGFQDCQVLEKILDECGHNKECLPLVLQRFSEEQCKNGQAIADLAFDHYTQLRSGIAGKNYYIRRAVDHILHRICPCSWPLEYDMVAFSQHPYSDCLQEKRRQEHVLQNLLYCFILVPLFGFIIIICMWWTSKQHL